MKLVGGVRGGLALLDDDECRRAIEAGERDIDDGGGFFRGMARPGTALMVAYVDEFRDRFRVGIGRGRVTSVVREPGIRGVRRGGMPVTARPARGAGGGPGLAERGFEAGRRTRLAGPRATGHRDGPKPGIMRAKRRKPPHYKSGKKQAISPAPRQTATLPRYGQNNDGRANLAGGQHAHRQSALMSPHRRHQDCGSRISVVEAPSSKLRLR